MSRFPSAGFVARWQRRVDRWLAAYDAAWDELAAAPGSDWTHPAHARAAAARRRLATLLALRDAIQRRGHSRP